MSNSGQVNRRKEAFEKIDCLRFWAANGVVFDHFLDAFVVRKSGYDDPMGLGTWECWFGWFCVGLFFIMSGFVISNSVQTALSKGRTFDLLDFWKKRIFRIYPVAWGSLLFSVLAYGVICLIPLHGANGTVALPGDVFSYSLYADVPSFLYSLLLPPLGYHPGFMNIAMWSLAYEVAFYLLFGALFALSLRVSRTRLLCAGLFTLAALGVWFDTALPFSKDGKDLHGIIRFLKYFPCWNFIPYFSIWLMGVHLEAYFRAQRPFLKAFKFYAPIVFAFIVVAKWNGSPWNYNQYYEISPVTAEPAFSTLLTMAYTGILGLLFYAILTKENFRFWGQGFAASAGRRYSYTLYATHFMFIYGIFALLGERLLALDNLWGMSAVCIFLLLLSNSFAYGVAPVLENRDLWIGKFDELTAHSSGLLGRASRALPSIAFGEGGTVP